jgi:hypothetical protein
MCHVGQENVEYNTLSKKLHASKNKHVKYLLSCKRKENENFSYKKAQNFIHNTHKYGVCWHFSIFLRSCCFLRILIDLYWMA